LKATFLIHCPDQTGIISSVTSFIHKTGGNIIYLDQHVDMEAGVFFMRLEGEFADKEKTEVAIEARFEKELAGPYSMEWSVHFGDERPKMAVFVSKYSHCLYDLLIRFSTGELKAEIPLIISNHADLKSIADQFNIPFYHIPVSRENKGEAEEKQLELLKRHNVDFIVLARYMQIVTSSMISSYPNKIINIHHSFLPAFAGAKPYHAAFSRGVKIIGATSHYVTEELDAGPIIEQDTTRVSHVHKVNDFIEKGRDLEKLVLSRAVQLHVNRKTMVYNNKTVIFT
jgi:formyltetrahydrofolate deformylase